jgi:hypothetical protein
LARATEVSLEHGKIVTKVLSSWPLLYGNNVIVIWRDGFLASKLHGGNAHTRPVQPVAVAYAFSGWDSI